MLTYLLDDDSKSMYVQLYERIRDDIERGWIRPGQKLPSKREFAAHLGVSAVTVQHAYDELVDEGYIESVPKSGFFTLDVGNPHPIDPSVVQEISSNTQSNSGDHHQDSEPSASTEHEIANKAQKDSDHTACDMRPCKKSFAWGPQAQWISAMRKVQKTATDAEVKHASSIFISALLHTIQAERHMRIDADQVICASSIQEIMRRINMMAHLVVDDKAQSIAAKNTVWYAESMSPSRVHICKTYGITARHAKTDRAGIQPDALGDEANMVYCRPLHGFPNATTMPIARRNDLLDWVDAVPSHLIVEDDRPAALRLADQNIPPLYFQDPRHVIVVSALHTDPVFSCAYAVVPHGIAQRAMHVWGASFFTNDMPAMDLLTCAYLLRNGDYARYMGKLKRRYRLSYDAFSHVMTMHMGAKEEYGDTSGRRQTLLTPRLIGMQNAPYFIVQLPKQYDVSAVCHMLNKGGIYVSSTSEFGGFTTSSANEGIIFDMTGIPESDARSVALTLCDVLAEKEALRNE